MNSKKLFILDYDILFNILSELKDNFNFEIIKVSQEDFNKKKINLNMDYLILSKNPNNEYSNYLKLSETPIKIQKLFQKINVEFLKNKFHYQSEINIGSYKLNLNSREISRKDLKLNLTERETNLIIFLKESIKPVKINLLQKEVWDYGEKLETHTVETHIYRLRKKIKEKFNDEKFIVSLKEGYKIF
tara:strand:+ start:398 stop:961 length:564 start_codon:yes stop_codon:yes gene_type:complete